MEYPGGKNSNGVWQWIINQMPPHEIYVEAFAGSAVVMRMKRPAAVNIAIDNDAAVAADLTSFFSTMTAIDVICDDAISHLRKKRYGPETLIYADPPYLMETRRGKGKIYRHEFGSEEQHKKLLALLTSKDWRVVLSGYRSGLYDDALRGWRRIEREVVLHNGIKAVECLWMNYPEPIELHDYRFLGENFRERDRLKRLRHRWKMRLLRMPILERRALSSMLVEIAEEDRRKT